MVRPAQRSHSEARHLRRLPGNTNGIRYIRRPPKAAHCPVTGQILAGVPKIRPAKMRQLAKSERRPTRMYGGVLSHTAVANAIQAKILKESESSEE
jgi:large subunit ribosomal protein L34e